MALNNSSATPLLLDQKPHAQIKKIIAPIFPSLFSLRNGNGNLFNICVYAANFSDMVVTQDNSANSVC